MTYALANINEYVSRRRAEDGFTSGEEALAWYAGPEQSRVLTAE